MSATPYIFLSERLDQGNLSPGRRERESELGMTQKLARGGGLALSDISALLPRFCPHDKIR